MIYLSTSTYCDIGLEKGIIKLSRSGFNNLELSGGPIIEPSDFIKIKKLKNELNINFRLHNYFPVPKKEFVINFASTNAQIRKLSRNLVLKAIEFSNEIESSIYGMHCGFLVDPNPKDLGKTLESEKLTDKSTAFKIFIEEVNNILISAKRHGVKIYLENNVFSKNNFLRFKGKNPFLGCNYKELFLIKKSLPEVGILLDLAHLKVSANSLDFDFDKELDLILPLSDYLHLSDNNGLSDTNKVITKDTLNYYNLNKKKLEGKEITLEIYNNIDDCKSSLMLLENILLNKNV